jgi:ZIP family zinc transporter
MLGWSEVTTFLVLPGLVTVLGGIMAAFRVPGPVVRSSLQHFAAGVVFAVVAIELLPDVVREHAPGVVAGGFALGVALMLGVRRLTRGSGAEKGERPAALVAGVAVDVAIDGLLLGLGFVAGEGVGRLLAIGLTLEGLSLGLATAASLGQAGFSRGKIVATTAVLALLFPAGGLVGLTVLQGLSGAGLAAVLAFGSAALLYLVTEELLAEAHEVPETTVATALFFAGFLLFLMLRMMQ